MKNKIKKNLVLVFVGIILISTMNFVAMSTKNMMNSYVSDCIDYAHLESEIFSNVSKVDGASKMNIHFKLIGGATWIIEIEELKIACDPVLCPNGTVLDFGLFKSKRIKAPVYIDEDFQNIDLWLITHDHEDHLDEIGLSKIDSEATIISHKNAIDELKKTKSNNIIVLRWFLYEKKILDIDSFEVTVEAIPAIHAKNRIVALTAGGVNGYWVTVKYNTETISIYISGDTVTRGIVLNSLRSRKADLFIPNMGGARVGTGILGMILRPLTLTARMMKRMKKIINPQVTIPVHFGTFSHYTEPISEVEKWQDPSIKILKPGEEIIVNPLNNKNFLCSEC